MSKKKKKLTLSEAQRYQQKVDKVSKDLGLLWKPWADIYAALGEKLGWPTIPTKAEGPALIETYLERHHPDWLRTSTQAAQSKAQKFSKKYWDKHAQVNKKRPEPRPSRDVTSDGFLLSYEWRKLRMEVLVEQGATCQCCGAQASRDRVKMNVDHIKPRRLYPSLALEKSNLQVLCDACNHGKGNWDQTDWRGEDSPVHVVENGLKPRLVKKVTVQ